MRGMKLYIIVLIFLLIAATIIYFIKTNSTIKKELRDFAVEDTASVNKIFMVNKANEQVVIERNGNKWIVNNKYEARKDAIDLILYTLNRVEVKSPVSKSAFDNTVKLLSAQNVKVEVYQNDKLTKVIYVGGPTKDSYGTYMMLENSATPFIVHIPGFYGYLSTRFFVQEHLWRSQSIFNYSFNEISEINVEYPSNKENSFHVISSNNNFTINPVEKSVKQINYDTSYVKEYIARFKAINFESLVVNIDSLKKDSILKSSPFAKIKIKDINGIENKLTAYLRPASGTIDDDGVPHIYDPDRLYAFLNNGEMVIIQYYVFDPLFMKYADFIKK